MNGPSISVPVPSLPPALKWLIMFESSPDVFKADSAMELLPGRAARTDKICWTTPTSDYTRPEWMRMITIYTSYWGQPRTASISLQTLPQENAYNFSNVIIIFLLNSKFSKQCTPQRFLSLSILKQSKSLSCVAVASWLLHKFCMFRHNKTLSCLLSYKNQHFHYLLLSLLLMS